MEQQQQLEVVQRKEIECTNHLKAELHMVVDTRDKLERVSAMAMSSCDATDVSDDLPKLAEFEAAREQMDSEW